MSGEAMPVPAGQARVTLRAFLVGTAVSDADLAAIGPAWQPVIATLASANGTGRIAAFQALSAAWPNQSAILDAVFQEHAAPATTGRTPRIPKLGTDLMARTFAPVRWVVPNLLPEGFAILAARSKIGKTWLSLGGALAVSGGGLALGKVQVEGGSALYLCLEDGEARLQRRLRHLLGNEPIPARFHYDDQWAKLDDGGLDDLDAWLRTHEDARLIVIDTLKRVKPKARAADSLYDNEYNALSPLQDLAKQYRVGIVGVMHTRKSAGEDFMDTVSGSIAIPASADGVLVMNRARGAADATLSIGHRDLPQELQLAIQRDGATGHWTLLGDAEAYQRSQERSEILTALGETGGPMTPKAVADLLVKPHQNVKQLLYRMARDGDIRHHGNGTYSLLPNDHPDHQDYQVGRSSRSANGDQGDRYIQAANPGFPA